MKKMLMFSVVVMMMVISGYGAADAAEFQPNVLKILNHWQVLSYDFGGSPLEIPLEISGTSCTLYFSVYTKESAEEISKVQNGYLGWHYVNHIDTCIYVSEPYEFDIGKNFVYWDGRDMNSKPYPSLGHGCTYYLWAYDSTSPPQFVSEHMKTGAGVEYISSIEVIDDQGRPRSNPLWYTTTDQWIIGSDPSDVSAKLTSELNLPENWSCTGNACIVTEEFYRSPFNIIPVHNKETNQFSLLRYEFVPDGNAKIDVFWGPEAPFGDIIDTNGGIVSGICHDRRDEYIYLSVANINSTTEPHSMFYIYDMDGWLVEEVDLTPWWASEHDLTNGLNLAGGPLSMSEKRGNVILSSHVSCLVQMIYLSRYLDTGEFDDLFIWSNGNGDYFSDRNFEETALNPWICHDGSKNMFERKPAVDKELFSVKPLDNNNIALFAPDGTGIGHLSLITNDNTQINGIEIIDYGSAFDGMYVSILEKEDAGDGTADNHYSPGKLGYIGHDVVKGLIYDYRRELEYLPNPGYLHFMSDLGVDYVIENVPFKSYWNSNLYGVATLSYSIDNGESWMPLQENFSIFNGYQYIQTKISGYSGEAILRLSLTASDGSDHGGLQTIFVMPANSNQFFSYENDSTGFHSIITIPSNVAFDQNNRPLTSLDEIGVFNKNGICIGSGVWKEGEDLDIVVWLTTACNDEITLLNDSFSFKLWDNETNVVSDAEAIIGSEIKNFRIGQTYMIEHLYVPGTVSVDTERPMTHTLLPNRPNPFNPVTGIPFTLAGDSDIELSVYNITGEKVATLADGFYPAGSHSIEWDASGFASGIYFYRLRAGEFMETRKMTLVK